MTLNASRLGARNSLANQLSPMTQDSVERSIAKECNNLNPVRPEKKRNARESRAEESGRGRRKVGKDKTEGACLGYLEGPFVSLLALFWVLDSSGRPNIAASPL